LRQCLHRLFGAPPEGTITTPLRGVSLPTRSSSDDDLGPSPASCFTASALRSDTPVVSAAHAIPRHVRAHAAQTTIPIASFILSNAKPPVARVAPASRRHLASNLSQSLLSPLPASPARFQHRANAPAAHRPRSPALGNRRRPCAPSLLECYFCSGPATHDHRKVICGTAGIRAALYACPVEWQKTEAQAQAGATCSVSHRVPIVASFLVLASSG